MSKSAHNSPQRRTNKGKGYATARVHYMPRLPEKDSLDVLRQTVNTPRRPEIKKSAFYQPVSLKKSQMTTYRDVSSQLRRTQDELFDVQARLIEKEKMKQQLERTEEMLSGVTSAYQELQEKYAEQADVLATTQQSLQEVTNEHNDCPTHERFNSLRLENNQLNIQLKSQYELKQAEKNLTQTTPVSVVTVKQQDYDRLKWRVEQSNRATTKALQELHDTKSHSIKLQTQLDYLKRYHGDMEKIEKEHITQRLAIQQAEAQVSQLKQTQITAATTIQALEDKNAIQKAELTELREEVEALQVFKADLAEAEENAAEEERKYIELEQALAKETDRYSSLLHVHNTVCTQTKYDLADAKHALIVQKKDGLVLEAHVTELLTLNKSKGILSKKLHTEMTKLLAEFRELTATEKLLVDDAENCFGHLVKSRHFLEKLLEKHQDVTTMSTRSTRLKRLQKGINKSEHGTMNRLELVKEIQSFDSVYKLLAEDVVHMRRKLVKLRAKWRFRWAREAITKQRFKSLVSSGGSLQPPFSTTPGQSRSHSRAQSLNTKNGSGQLGSAGAVPSRGSSRGSLKDSTGDLTSATSVGRAKKAAQAYGALSEVKTGVSGMGLAGSMPEHSKGGLNPFLLQTHENDKPVEHPEQKSKRQETLRHTIDWLQTRMEAVQMAKDEKKQQHTVTTVLGKVEEMHADFSREFANLEIITRTAHVVDHAEIDIGCAFEPEPTESGSGLKVSSCEAGGSATRIGIVPGDILLQLHGMELKRPQDVLKALYGLKAGHKAAVIYKHHKDQKLYGQILEIGAQGIPFHTVQIARRLTAIKESDFGAAMTLSKNHKQKENKNDSQPEAHEVAAALATDTRPSTTTPVAASSLTNLPGVSSFDP